MGKQSKTVRTNKDGSFTVTKTDGKGRGSSVTKKHGPFFDKVVSKTTWGK